MSPMKLASECMVGASDSRTEQFGSGQHTHNMGENPSMRQGQVLKQNKGNKIILGKGHNVLKH